MPSPLRLQPKALRAGFAEPLYRNGGPGESERSGGRMVAMNNHMLEVFPAGRGGLLILLLVFGSVLLDSCQGTGSRGETTEYTEQDLHEDLAGYAARYSSITSAAADEIADLTDSRRIRRSTLVWKLRMIPLVNDYAFRDDPQEAYVEVLNLVAATRRYLTEGDGREIFGEHKAIAVRAAEELETQAVEIGQRFLGTERIDRLREEIEVMVAENPIRGRDFSVEAVQNALAKVESGDSFAHGMAQYASFPWFTGCTDDDGKRAPTPRPGHR